MVEVKDKSVTVEALSVLHEHNKATYETKENVENLANRITPIENGGTNSADGATGLANLFAAGATVLSVNQYGDELPEPGIAGRIFFKRIVEESESSEASEE